MDHLSQLLKFALSQYQLGKAMRIQSYVKLLDMNACHILLGRPWQCDVDATHRGWQNVYTFL